jgi:hypothetical protein
MSPGLPAAATIAAWAPRGSPFSIRSARRVARQDWTQVREFTELDVEGDRRFTITCPMGPGTGCWSPQDGEMKRKS